jgi:hypothetical protein
MSNPKLELHLRLMVDEDDLAVLGRKAARDAGACEG